MTRQRWLAPPEYGAYAELVFPLVTAFAAGGLSVAGTAFAAAATAGFLASEPLAIVAGTRGERLRRQHADAARRWLGVLMAGGGLAGAAGLWLAPPDARLLALVPVGAAVLLIPALVRGRSKTLRGELLVAAALATMVLPVGRSGGMPLPFALAASAVWLGSFWVATLTVHAIKARHKPELAGRWTLWGAPLLIAAVASLAGVAVLGGHVRLPVALGVLPVAVVAAVAAAWRVHPRRLRRVGWSLVVANLVTVTLLLSA